MAVARGEVGPPRRTPASFQADLGVLPHAPGSLPFSARLYGETGADSASVRYRLDAFGFPSAVVASWLWSDGRWTLVRHDRGEVITGEGSSLGVEDSPVQIPDVRVVLGVFAGEPLPGYPGVGKPEADAGGLVRWRYQDETWEASIDPSTGLCREVRSASLTLSYARHHVRDGFVVPDAIEVVTRGGDTLLTLGVRDWKASPVWIKNPFDLVIPSGYKRRQASGVE